MKFQQWGRIIVFVEKLIDGILQNCVSSIYQQNWQWIVCGKYSPPVLLLRVLGGACLDKLLHLGFPYMFGEAKKMARHGFSCAKMTNNWHGGSSFDREIRRTWTTADYTIHLLCWHIQLFPALLTTDNIKLSNHIFRISSDLRCDGADLIAIALSDMNHDVVHTVHVALAQVLVYYAGNLFWWRLRWWWDNGLIWPQMVLRTIGKWVLQCRLCCWMVMWWRIGDRVAVADMGDTISFFIAANAFL